MSHWPEIEAAKLLDEVYIGQRTVSPGGIFRNLRVYFQSFDPLTSVVHVSFDKEGKRRTIITVRAIEFIKDGITGQIKYISSPRNLPLGNNF